MRQIYREKCRRLRIECFRKAKNASPVFTLSFSRALVSFFVYSDMLRLISIFLMATSCRSKQESGALSGIWKSPEGLKGPLNDVEETRGGCLLVLRHNLLVFITDDAQELLSFSLSSSTAILRHLYFRRLAPFLWFYPESSALVFRRNTINHFSQSAGMTPPLHPRLSSKRACFVNDESFRLPDECVIIQVTIIVRSHTWVCHTAS